MWRPQAADGHNECDTRTFACDSVVPSPNCVDWNGNKNDGISQPAPWAYRRAPGHVPAHGQQAMSSVAWVLGDVLGVTCRVDPRVRDGFGCPLEQVPLVRELVVHAQLVEDALVLLLHTGDQHGDASAL